MYRHTKSPTTISSKLRVQLWSSLTQVSNTIFSHFYSSLIKYKQVFCPFKNSPFACFLSRYFCLYPLAFSPSLYSCSPFFYLLSSFSYKVSLIFLVVFPFESTIFHHFPHLYIFTMFVIILFFNFLLPQQCSSLFLFPFPLL